MVGGRGISHEPVGALLGERGRTKLGWIPCAMGRMGLGENGLAEALWLPRQEHTAATPWSQQKPE